MINLVACIALSDEQPSIDTPTIATERSPESPTAMGNQNWVIVAKEHAEEMGIDSWLFESDGFWTPSADDVQKLEEKLAEYLSRNSNQFYRQAPVWQRLDEYQRQYIGLERGGGFLCRELRIRARSDGGWKTALQGELSLSELEDAYKEGLIVKDEYEVKRAEILKNL